MSGSSLGDTKFDSLGANSYVRYKRYTATWRLDSLWATGTGAAFQHYKYTYASGRLDEIRIQGKISVDHQFDPAQPLRQSASPHAQEILSSAVRSLPDR